VPPPPPPLLLLLPLLLLRPPPPPTTSNQLTYPASLRYHFQGLAEAGAWLADPANDGNARALAANLRAYADAVLTEAASQAYAVAALDAYAATGRTASGTEGEGDDEGDEAEMDAAAYLAMAAPFEGWHSNSGVWRSPGGGGGGAGAGASSG